MKNPWSQITMQEMNLSLSIWHTSGHIKWHSCSQCLGTYRCTLSGWNYNVQVSSWSWWCISNRVRVLPWFWPHRSSPMFSLRRSSSRGGGLGAVYKLKVFDPGMWIRRMEGVTVWLEQLRVITVISDSAPAVLVKCKLLDEDWPASGYSWRTRSICYT